MMNLMNRIEIPNKVYEQCFFTVDIWHILIRKKIAITIIVILCDIQIIQLDDIGKTHI